MSNPTPTDHLVWAICTTVRPDRDEDGERPCRVPCSTCRAGAAAVVRELAEQAGSAKHWHVDQLIVKAAELEVPNA